MRDATEQSNKTLVARLIQKDGCKLRHADSVGTSIVNRYIPTAPTGHTAECMDIPGSANERPLIESAGCTVRETATNFLNYMLGSPLLASGHAVACGGWCTFAALGFIAILTVVTGHMLNACVNTLTKSGVTECGTYSSLVRHSLGKPAQAVLITTQYCALFSWTVSFLLAAKVNMALLIPELNEDEWACVLSAVALPTAFIESYRLLSMVSMVGIFSIFFAVSTSFSKCVVTIVQQDIQSVDRDLINPGKIALACGMFVGTFSGHIMMPAMRSSMKRPERFGTVINAVYAVLALLVAAMATVSYLGYGRDAKPLINQNFPAKNPVSRVVQVALVVAMLSKIGLTINPVAKGIEKWCYKFWANVSTDSMCQSGIRTNPRVLERPLAQEALERKSDEQANSEKRVDGVERLDATIAVPPMYTIIVRTLLVGAALGVSIVVPNFAFMLSITGSVMALILAVMLPVACYLRMGNNGQPLQLWRRVLCYVLVAVSPVFSVIAVYQTVMQD